MAHPKPLGFIQVSVCETIRQPASVVVVAAAICFFLVFFSPLALLSYPFLIRSLLAGVPRTPHFFPIYDVQRCQTQIPISRFLTAAHQHGRPIAQRPAWLVFLLTFSLLTSVSLPQHCAEWHPVHGFASLPQLHVGLGFVEWD